MLNEVVNQLGLLAERGVLVTMRSRFEYEVGGFYKSNTVRVNVANQTVTARYDEVTEFDPANLTETLVDLNWDWWLRSKDRYDGWSQPDGAWLPLLEAAGYDTE